MTRDITPGCLETWLRDVLNQNTVSPTRKQALTWQNRSGVVARRGLRFDSGRTLGRTWSLIGPGLTPASPDGLFGIMRTSGWRSTVARPGAIHNADAAARGARCRTALRPMSTGVLDYVVPRHFCAHVPSSSSLARASRNSGSSCHACQSSCLNARGTGGTFSSVGIRCVRPRRQHEAPRASPRSEGPMCLARPVPSASTMRVTGGPGLVAIRATSPSGCHLPYRRRAGDCVHALVVTNASAAMTTTTGTGATDDRAGVRVLVGRPRVSGSS